MRKAIQVIDRIAEMTDSVLLMHSLSGKDSIALLDLLYPRFKRVVCVYMYLIPNLEHIKPYYRYAKRKKFYPLSMYRNGDVLSYIAVFVNETAESTLTLQYLSIQFTTFARLWWQIPNGLLLALNFLFGRK